MAPTTASSKMLSYAAAASVALLSRCVSADPIADMYWPEIDEFTAIMQSGRMLAVDSACLEPVESTGSAFDARSPFWVFVVGATILVLGFIFYGRFVAGMLNPDDSKTTPALSLSDGVDFVAMSDAKVFLIQLLNIAGLGPIFGPILGGVYGPAAFGWIIIGCIFCGSVMDYLVGMMSIISQGASLPVLVGNELGNYAKHALNVVTLILVILVGVVFVKGPAALLANMTGGDMAVELWTAGIFAYYILATVVPINIIIGKIYPLFGLALIFMTVGLLGGTVASGRPFPSLQTTAPSGASWFPTIFIIISCSALSGFHTTQSPMMARCIKKQSSGFKIFFGAMITEGAIGLIWAMAPLVFYGGQAGLAKALTCAHNNPAAIVNTVLHTLLGPIGGAISIVGVVVLPITSGDTAFRCARLIVAEFFRAVEGQKDIKRRLLISVPMFAIAFGISLVDFKMIWKYFNFTNQLLSAMALWAGAAFLRRTGKHVPVAFVPATFITLCLTTYICHSAEFGTKAVPLWISATIGAVVTACITVAMSVVLKRLPVETEADIKHKEEKNLEEGEPKQAMTERMENNNSVTDSNTAVEQQV
mmetsp:Transcript_27055/g.58920  ORF Transcript_27055/g.58920 Transcript_27055/m.58920 type:complete len:590 (+) Transcript_27055:99-1868(+)